MIQNQESRRTETSKSNLETQMAAELPMIASIRTGLASKDDALMQKLPSEYSGKTVGEAIDYLTTTKLSEDQRPLAHSVNRELSQSGSVIVVNGRQATKSDPLSKYAIKQSHEIKGGATRQYLELEIEVSAVQQGGLRYR